MTRNIYTPHRAERLYDRNNNEIGRVERSGYAPNYYEDRYPERSLSGGRFIEVGCDRYDCSSRESLGRYDNEMFGRRAPQPAPKKSHAGLVVATIAVTLALVFSVGTVVFFATKDNNKLTAAPSTSVSTVSGDVAAKGSGSDGTVAAQSVTDAPQQSGTTDAAMAVAQRAYADHSLEATAEENVVKVDGERVYMDTKRLAPAGTGNPAHFYANGKTSYGFDWNYSADNGNFVLACNYNFDKQQYDFTFYGVTPGVAHITVYYNTDDNTQVPVQLTINVDDNLNVTQG